MLVKYDKLVMGTNKVIPGCVSKKSQIICLFESCLSTVRYIGQKKLCKQHKTQFIKAVGHNEIQKAIVKFYLTS